MSPTSGTGDVALGAIRTINGVAGTNGNFSGVVTSVNGETPTNGAVTLDVVYTVNETAPDANGNVDVGTVRSVDGVSPDQQGAVSFGLAGNKWVKTDASGHLTTTSSDDVVTIPNYKAGLTMGIIVVTGVTWNGSDIVVSRTQLDFTNGVLTGTTNKNSTKIGTVPYT